METTTKQLQRNETTTTSMGQLNFAMEFVQRQKWKKKKNNGSNKKDAQQPTE